MQSYGKFLALLILPILIYLASFATLVYDFELYNKLFLSTNVNTTLAQNVTQQLFAYFKNDDYSTPSIQPFTDDENNHVQDVKILIKKTFTVFYLLILIFTVLLFFSPHKQSIFFYGGSLAIILPILALVFNFTTLFTIFHAIFFPQGNWQFDAATTTLVNIYPAEFFKQFTFQILIRGEIIAAIILLASFYHLVSAQHTPSSKHR